MPISETGEVKNRNVLTFSVHREKQLFNVCVGLPRPCVKPDNVCRNENYFRSPSQILLMLKVPNGKEDQLTSWKKVGNKKHFKFNNSLETKFDSAIAAIDKKNLDKAKQELQEGKKRLAEHQKLIELDNQSECSWTTVSAYVNYDLVDTLDDEWHISKAKKSAKKALEAKRGKLQSRSSGFQIQLLCSQ